MTDRGRYAAWASFYAPSGEVLAECDHLHNNEDEALSCARDLSLLLAQQALREVES